MQYLRRRNKKTLYPLLYCASITVRLQQKTVKKP
jgi:hypothetical protein